MAADVEVSVVMRFQADREPSEEEMRVQVEDLWLGQLVLYEQEEV